jgi:hypothetical protein
MEEIIIYGIKVSVVLLVLYLFYISAIRNSTFYRFQRCYLLLSPLVSLIIPLLHWNLPEGAPLTVVGNLLNEVSVIAARAGQSSLAETSYLSTWFLIVYLSFGMVPVVLLFVNIRNIIEYKRKSTLVCLDEATLYLVDDSVSSFSFGNWIFMDYETFESVQRPVILNHELAHVKQRHTFDIILGEIFCSILWFHPISWLNKRALKQVHEYLADNAVINKGIESGTYMQILFQQACPPVSLSYSNHFNQSLIKRRFTMITKNKSGIFSALALAMGLPIILSLCFLMVNSLHFSAIAQTGQNTVSLDQSVKKQAGVQEDKQGEKLHSKPEKEAEYPGGFKALQTFIVKEIKYPETAKKWGINAKVFVAFVVSPEGKITKVAVKKTQHSFADEKAKKPSEEVVKQAVAEMEKEAFRIVKSIPEAWTPAEDKGKKVASDFTIPIAFKLN